MILDIFGLKYRGLNSIFNGESFMEKGVVFCEIFNF